MNIRTFMILPFNSTKNVYSRAHIKQYFLDMELIVLNIESCSFGLFSANYYFHAKLDKIITYQTTSDRLISKLNTLL
jgi:hypothetical protein